MRNISANLRVEAETAKQAWKEAAEYFGNFAKDVGVRLIKLDLEAWKKQEYYFKAQLEGK